MTGAAAGFGTGSGIDHDPGRWGATEVSVRDGQELALDHVSFLASVGQVTAVVGGDGAGKTTLLRLLAGARRRPAAWCADRARGKSGTYPRGRGYTPI